ncbi:ABC transporter permease [Celeribacter indicus]|uniref:Binding-protein-dependent transporter inner membrane component n=1 Tax=Celeribacter indicus TaxID=1208324 RepID=A0A0B5DWQ2_9RHOB|nr:ABC transporter permease [Celeribacter indicus]AJE47863.1 binding-protein-dependent transporter inner membrane component [Celeribacter indicus]SDW25267.1 NitT/TauT family transport system permease protein [Celeribacter indicus]
MKLKKLQKLRPLIGVFGLLAIWQLVVMGEIVDPVLLPPPGKTFVAAWDGLFGSGKLAFDFGKTVERSLMGIALAAAIGIPVGVVLGASEKVYRSVEFVIDFFRSTPASAVFPLFLLFFGVGDQTKIYIAAFGASLAIIFNTAYGVMNARKTRVLAARVMGAPAWQRMLVVLLESMPQTFIGLRTGATLALVLMITAEMLLGSVDGLGLRVFEEQQLFNMPAMYAAILLAGVLGYAINLSFFLLERTFVHWAGR